MDGVGRGVARGMARLGVVQRGTAWRGMAWCCVMCCCMVWQCISGRGVKWHRAVGRVRVELSLARGLCGADGAVLT